MGPREAILQQACASLESKASYRVCDLAKLEAIPALVEELRKDGIVLDILVNNAGINLKSLPWK